MEATDVAIVGGGPGGLAAASALSKAGLSVKVFERMPELYPVGAAIVSPPHIQVISSGNARKLRSINDGTDSDVLPDDDCTLVT